jgi:uridylate kinase
MSGKERGKSVNSPETIDQNLGQKTKISNTNLKYKKVLLKISGEALMGDKGYGIDPTVVKRVANEIKRATEMGVSMGVVVGGGNIFRGMQESVNFGMEQADADYVGMIATVMNCLVLQGVMKKVGVTTRVLTAIGMDRVAEPYIRLRAIRHMEKGRVVIFGAGTGNPFFSTDTTAALRASEIGAEVLLMAKNRVDGIYSSDPRINKDAKLYDKLNYDDLIKNDLKVMDTASVSLCKNNKIPIIVFNFDNHSSIEKILHGERVGTLVGGE